MLSEVFDQFNEPCLCYHRADEHMAGDGQCFLCDCPKFRPIPFVSSAEARRYKRATEEKKNRSDKEKT